ncbi:MAG: diadenylate cyclase CdaA [Clostridia bacterium]|nr:diadenylate cyclase CdaA [Clostridia bacterium]
MNAILDTLYTVWNQFVYTISNVGFFDIIDILLIAFIVYKAIEFLRETRAGQLVKGIVFLIALYAFSIVFKLAVLRWLLSAVFGSAIVAIAIIFQPELRRILERMGQTKIGGLQSSGGENSETISAVEKICKSAGQFSKTKTGALVVFERKTQLGEIINTGTVIDAEVSESLIGNIFFPKSPLHDGAVIVRDGRIYAASCILPLTQSSDFSSQLGTRHRAAIGMTENSDAVVLIVSEETGIISIAFNGQISRNHTTESAFETIKEKLTYSSEQEKGSFLKRIKNIFLNDKSREEEK